MYPALIAFILGVLVRQKQQNSGNADDKTNAGQCESYPDRPLTVVSIPPPKSDEEKANEKKKSRRKTIKFCAEIGGLAVLVFYTVFTGYMALKMKQSTEATEEAANAATKAANTAADQFKVFTAVEQPDIYVYSVCVKKTLPRWNDKNPTCGFEGGLTIRGLQRGKPFHSNMIVEFENFGRRAAVVRRIKIKPLISREFNIEPSMAYDLSKELKYNHQAIRPSGIPPRVERDYVPLNLTAAEVNDFLNGDRFLWYYGAIQLHLYEGKVESFPFCGVSNPVGNKGGRDPHHYCKNKNDDE